MKNDFTQGNAAKSILMFSLPMLLGNIFQQLYSAVDAMVVGRYVGKDALAAVSGTWSSVMLVLAIALGFATGLSVVISQLYGAGDLEKLRRALSTAIFIALGFAVVFSAVGYILSPTLLRVLKVPDEIFADALLYIRIGFITLIGPFAYNGCAGVLQAIGDSKTPLIFLIISSVTNVVLDLVFVIVFKWGVAGAAVATAIAQILSGVLAIYYIATRIPALHISKDEWVFDKDLVKDIARYGIPSSMQMGVFSVAMMSIQGLANSFGTDMMAAFSASNRIEDFAGMPISNLASSLTLFVGQNIGAGQHERAKKGLRSTLIMLAVVCAVVAVALPVLGTTLIGLFVKESEVLVIETGVKSINFISMFFFISALNQAFGSFLQGAGDTTYTMLSSLLVLVVRIPLAYYLASFESIGYMAIWYSLPCGWAAAGLFKIARYLTGKWKTKGMQTSKNTLEVQNA